MRQIYSEFVFLKHTLNEYLARFQLSPKLQPHTNPTTLLSLSSSFVTCDRSEKKARGLNYHVPKFKPTDVALLDTSSSRSHPREVRVSSPPLNGAAGAETQEEQRPTQPTPHHINQVERLSLASLRRERFIPHIPLLQHPSP